MVLIPLQSYAERERYMWVRIGTPWSTLEDRGRLFLHQNARA